MQEDKSNKDNLSTFQSENLLEKLKILNFEQLLQEYKMKTISRYYFVKPENPGEQFFMFYVLCWWLAKNLGKNMTRPQESDDPNVVIENIIKILQEMDVSIDFSPNKLMSGAGAACIFVLDNLATQVLKVSKITFKRPVITQEDETALEYLEDNAEIILERLEDENNGTYSDDSDGDMHGDGNISKQLNWIGRPLQDNTNNLIVTDGTAANAANGREADLAAYQQQWLEECERVLPQLKIYVKADVRDWRAHLSQMEIYKTSMDEHSSETLMQLKKLYNEFSYNLEKMESREKHLNNELQPLIKNFKELCIELSNIQHAEQQVKNDMQGLQQQLQEVMQENEVKKTQMEQRGQAMSDGSSVLHIKKAILTLKEEISHLNLEVALLINSVDQAILRQADQYMHFEANN